MRGAVRAEPGLTEDMVLDLLSAFEGMTLKKEGFADGDCVSGGWMVCNISMTTALIMIKGKYAVGRFNQLRLPSAYLFNEVEKSLIVTKKSNWRTLCVYFVM